MNQTPTEENSNPYKMGTVLFPFKKVACPLFLDIKQPYTKHSGGLDESSPSSLALYYKLYSTIIVILF